MQNRQIPEPTISRISLYLRALRNIIAVNPNKLTISSSEMANIMGISSAQIRKDLSYFGGEMGKPGRGYLVVNLITHFESILHLDRTKRAMIVGVGNLGSALAGYSGFKSSDFMLTALFDDNPAKIGTTIHELIVHSIDDIATLNKELKIEVGILCVPATDARDVARVMINSGVKVILNFAPVQITSSDDVIIRNVDLTKELQILSYYL